MNQQANDKDTPVHIDGAVKGILDLDSYLPYQFAVVTDMMSQRIGAAYSTQFDISIPEWRVLIIIAQEEHINASKVVDKTPMDKVAVSRSVSSLIEKNFVVREQNPNDRRAYNLQLTEMGNDITKKISDIALNWEKEIFDQFSINEKETIHKFLTRIKNVVDEK